MAMAKLFVDPRLSFINNFEECLQETEIWQCLTDQGKKKQWPGIYLPHDDNVRKVCSRNKVKDSNSDGNVDILINKLKSSFIKDINQTVFIAYDKFKLLKRSSNMNIVDVINKIERLYNNTKKYDYAVTYRSASVLIANEYGYFWG